MAGSIITMPVNGASDWSAFPSIVVAGLKSYMFVSLSDFTGNSAPKVEDGSYIVNNGSFYKMTPNGSTEAIGGLAAIAANSTIYFYHVPGTCTLLGSITAPVWSETKGGYYNGNDRCFGGCYKDGFGSYFNKHIFSTDGKSLSKEILFRNSTGLAESFLRIYEKVIEIGPWDMDTYDNIIIGHGGNGGNIISASAVIHKDLSSPSFNGSYVFSTDQGNASQNYILIDLTTIELKRLSGGFFDSADFNNGTMNRGYVFIKYIV
jgi:hypothetical protein